VPGVPPLLKSVVDELHKCNRCGFCQTRCPVYRVTGLEASVARGHSARLRAVLEGDLPLDGALRPAISECLMCRACTAECPPAIETDRIILAARASYLAQRQSRLQRFIFRTLLGRRALLRAAARLLGLAQRTGVMAAVKLLRLFPWFQGLAAAPQMISAPRTFLRDRISSDAAAKQVHYFVGCAIEYALPEVGEATAQVLRACGYGVRLAENLCCGLPPYSYGDLASAAELAGKNLEVFGDAAPILTECGSCSSFLKEYPRLFPDASSARARAEALAARVQDATEFLVQAELPELRPVDAVVTYHDPCHLSRYQQVTRPPRELIQRIPGIAYRELPEADWCCGGAGSYALTHHDRSVQILERKMRNIAATRASLVITACPACLMQLRYGAARFGLGVEVLHLSQLLARALPAR